MYLPQGVFGWPVVCVTGFFQNLFGVLCPFCTKFIVVTGFLGGYREHIVMPYHSTILSDTCHGGFHVRYMQGKKMPHMQSVN